MEDITDLPPQGKVPPQHLSWGIHCSSQGLCAVNYSHKDLHPKG